MIQIHVAWWCMSNLANVQGPDSIQRWHLASIGNPIVEIRRSYDRLISTMGFPILVRWHLYIESGPRPSFGNSHYVRCQRQNEIFRQFLWKPCVSCLMYPFVNCSSKLTKNKLWLFTSLAFVREITGDWRMALCREWRLNTICTVF